MSKTQASAGVPSYKDIEKQVRYIRRITKMPVDPYQLARAIDKACDHKMTDARFEQLWKTCRSVVNRVEALK